MTVGSSDLFKAVFEKLFNCLFGRLEFFWPCLPNTNRSDYQNCLSGIPKFCEFHRLSGQFKPKEIFYLVDRVVSILDKLLVLNEQAVLLFFVPPIMKFVKIF